MLQVLVALGMRLVACRFSPTWLMVPSLEAWLGGKLVMIYSPTMLKCRRYVTILKIERVYILSVVLLSKRVYKV